MALPTRLGGPLRLRRSAAIVARWQERDDEGVAAAHRRGGGSDRRVVSKLRTDPGYRATAPAATPDPDPSTTPDRDNVFAVAERLPGYAGAWLDDRGGRGQNPLAAVVNVQVTGDVRAAERKLREVWGGPLCVSQAKRSEKELARISAEVMSRSGTLHASHSRAVADLGVEYDDGTLQRELDRTYGEGSRQRALGNAAVPGLAVLPGPPAGGDGGSNSGARSQSRKPFTNSLA